MRIMFISDIHGSIIYAKKAIEKFESEKCDKLVITGDILYHDSHHGNPEDFNKKEVANLLNQYNDKIIAIRGNCDSDSDQWLLDFDMMEDYKEILLEDRKIFITHGHLFNRESMPRLNKGDLFIHGHFHVPMTEVVGEVYYLNPGSISLPRQNSKNSYGILDGDKFTVKDLEGTMVKEIAIL